MEQESFDKAAHSYDQTFTQTCIGKAQRERVWLYIDRNKFPEKSKVLELNCGTGEDAFRWSERKMNVLATDLSNEMIQVAKSKFPSLAFQRLDIRDSGEAMREKDIIFSNFGGFNCLTKTDIDFFFQEAAKKLDENGKIILVIMGKKCIWDNLFLLLKGKFREIGRRNTANLVSVFVENEAVPTWYYSPKEMINMAGSSFQVDQLKPIGLFVPPSYLSKWMTRNKWLFSILGFMEHALSFGFLANYADHYYIQFNKRK